MIFYRGWTHAFGQYDTLNLQNDSSNLEGLCNIQVCHHVDPKIGNRGLWINVYNPTSSQPCEQSAIYRSISCILKRLSFEHSFARDLSPDGEGCDDGHALAGVKLGDLKC